MVGPIICQLAGVAPTPEILEAASVFEYGTQGFPRGVYDLQVTEAKRLRAEINNWNLINGMHFTLPQINQISQQYISESAALNNSQRRGKPGQPANRQLRVQLERSIESVLNPGQREVLADYKACLIPPKNLKNPVRVGQAGDDSGRERWLSRIRAAEPDRWADMILNIIRDDIERFGPLSPEEKSQKEGLLYTVVLEASDMSDVEFELERAILAKQIAPRDRRQELRQEIASLQQAQNLPGAINRFILKPKFIEQLRFRGVQLSQLPPNERVNLSKGPQAENCEKGCAVKGTTGKIKKR
jgi:hypothetical protein